MRKIVLFVLMCVVVLGTARCRRRPSSTPPSTTSNIFSDDFNRTDEELAASSDWVVVEPSGSAFDVVGNLLHPTAGGGTWPEAYYNTPMTTTNYSVSVDISASATVTTFEIDLLNDYDVPDLQTAASGYRCIITQNTLYLFRLNTLVSSTSIAISMTSGHSHTLTFTRQGGDLTCTIDGTSGTATLSYTDASPYTSGYVGMLSYQTSNFIDLDNFIIDDL